jgi:hypothetical protein
MLKTIKTDTNVLEEHNACIFRVKVFSLETVGGMFLRNVGIYLQAHRALQTKISISKSLPP